jgi:hypothetical protein
MDLFDLMSIEDKEKYKAKSSTDWKWSMANDLRATNLTAIASMSTLREN